jgi:hypothetical protein
VLAHRDIRAFRVFFLGCNDPTVSASGRTNTTLPVGIPSSLSNQRAALPNFHVGFGRRSGCLRSFHKVFVFIMPPLLTRDSITADVVASRSKVTVRGIAYYGRAHGAVLVHSRCSARLLISQDAGIAPQHSPAMLRCVGAPADRGLRVMPLTRPV